MTRLKEHIGEILQATLSVVLIIVVIAQAGLGSMLEKLTEVKLAIFLGGLGVVLVQTVIAAVRWHLILTGLEIFVTRSISTRAYLGSMFFNQLLPASFGGDVFKFLRVRRIGCRRAQAFVAVLCERVFSVLAIVLMVAPALIILAKRNQHNVFDLSITLILGIVVAIILALHIERLPQRLQHWQVIQPVVSVTGILKAQLKNVRFSLGVIALSLLIQSMTVMYVVVMVLSLESGSDAYTAAAMVPFIFLAASLPVSLAGWGIREGAMVYGLSFANVSSSTALAVSIVLGLHLFLVGLLGGAVWLYERHGLEIN